jgi:hypothetical protein
LPFVTRLDPAGATELGALRLTPPAYFGDRNWSANWYAWRVLHQFVASVPNWAATVDADVTFTQIRTDLLANFKDQIDNLVLAARDERPDAMGLILSQDAEFFTDFVAVLTMKPESHPKTWRVLNIASLIGSFAVLYFKGKYEVPRPTQICPALLPPIPVPGHSSWPSGHSTQAHFMKNCMLRIFAAAGMPAGNLAVMTSDLSILADEIARNREIAGLHYPKDSEGGARLADLLDGTILTTGAVQMFDDAISAAKGEWQ